MLRKKIAIIVFTLIFPSIIFAAEIRGVVFRNGTQEAIAKVAVKLDQISDDQNSESISRLTLTDQNGSFTFSDLPIGNYNLTFTRHNYHKIENYSISISEKDQPILEISLDEIAIALKEVVVIGRDLPPKVISRQSLTRSELKRIPGTGGDALRAIQTLPGIGRANDFTGQLFIRGGAPEDNTFYFDRYPIRDIYHFGGLVSTISSEIINRIDVYAGGFGANYGRDAQAVIDIYSRRGDRDRLSGKFNLNMLYSEGLIETPIGENASWYLAGRRSYVDLVFDLINYETDVITAFPRFWDYQTKFSYKISDRFWLDLSAFASSDFAKLKIGEDDPDNDLSGEFYLKNGFNVQGVHFRALPTDRLTYDLNVSHSRELINFKIGKGYYLRLEPREIFVRHDLKYKVNDLLQLESGLTNVIGKFRASTFFPMPPEEGDPSFDFSLAQKNKIDQADNYYEVESYFQSRFDLAEFISTAIGLRIDYSPYLNGKLAIQPRMSLDLKVSSISEIRFAIGRYLQTPEGHQASELSGNPDLDEAKADHFILELEREIGEETHLKFAGYYKNLRDQFKSDPEPHPAKNVGYLNLGEGFARGAELLLQHRRGDRFFGWLSYAYSISKRRDYPDQPYRFYSFDQTHVATATASYNFSETFEIGAKWQYTTGNPFTPLACDGDLNLSCEQIVINPNNGQPIRVPIYGEVNSDRVPPFHRLDLRIAKKFTFDHLKIGAYLELLNTYNRKNALTYDYELDRDENGDLIRDENGEAKKSIVNQLPIIPYFGVTIEF